MSQIRDSRFCRPKPGQVQILQVFTIVTAVDGIRPVKWKCVGMSSKRLHRLLWATPWHRGRPLATAVAASGGAG